MTPSFDLETMMKLRFVSDYDMNYIGSMEKRMNEYASMTLRASNSKKRIFIDKIIFNGPATIVYWDDGTKTVVKCKPDDPYSKDAGVAMATLKKILGSGYGRYLTAVKKHIEKAK